MFVLRKIYCRSFQTVFWAALPFLPYRNPKIIPSVAGIPDVCRRKNVDSVMIVTDAGIRSLGLTEFLEKTLKESGISYCIYDRTVANPTIWNVEETRELYLEQGAKGIIAFGGGSSMDCAKAAGARIVKPRQSISQMKGLLKVHKKLPLLIAIPTTAGTGSETTLAAVITDSEKHHKYPINDFSLIPRYAVLDYHETLGLPKSITATTGMDALTHAVAHSLGGQYGTPHGLANAVILPIVLRMYGPACEKRLARHADKEGNPLYPVPVLMNRKELKEIYREVKGR